MAYDDQTKLLMGPGPSNPYPEATEALARPLAGHLDPAFLALLDECCERLRQVWRTGASTTLPISGTGSAGMEAAVVNLVAPGDRVLVAVNGLFGQRLAEVSRRAGGKVETLEFAWGTPVDPQRLAEAVRSVDPKVVAVVHAETSTGTLSDLATLASSAVKGDALLLADCVTSLGGLPLEVDAWGVDAAYSGTQKCLGVAPGLAPLTVTPRAWDRRVEQPQSWYLDLGLIGAYTGPARRYHHTAPVAMITSLHAGLGRILDEGLAAVWERHARCSRRLQDGLQALGLELFVAPEHRLPSLTTVVVPDGVDDAATRATLLGTHGVEIGGGVGEYAGTLWRIGCMGHNATDGAVDRVLTALATVLGSRPT